MPDYIEMVKNRKPGMNALYENPQSAEDLLAIADDLDLLANALEQQMREEQPRWRQWLAKFHI